jgi:hypothetical protein
MGLNISERRRIRKIKDREGEQSLDTHSTVKAVPYTPSRH